MDLRSIFLLKCFVNCLTPTFGGGVPKCSYNLLLTNEITRTPTLFTEQFSISLLASSFVDLLQKDLRFFLHKKKFFLYRRVDGSKKKRRRLKPKFLKKHQAVFDFNLDYVHYAQVLESWKLRVRERLNIFTSGGMRRTYFYRIKKKFKKLNKTNRKRFIDLLLGNIRYEHMTTFFLQTKNTPKQALLANFLKNINLSSISLLSFFDKAQSYFLMYRNYIYVDGRPSRPTDFSMAPKAYKVSMSRKSLKALKQTVGKGYYSVLRRRRRSRRVYRRASPFRRLKFKRRRYVRKSQRWRKKKKKRQLYINDLTVFNNYFRFEKNLHFFTLKTRGVPRVQESKMHRLGLFSYRTFN